MTNEVMALAKKAVELRNWVVDEFGPFEGVDELVGILSALDISVSISRGGWGMNIIEKSLGEIVSEGQERISNAVEKVIAKHEKELMEVELKLAADKKASLMPSQADDNKRRMTALSGSSDRYLDRLLMAQNRSLGVRYGHGLLGDWS